MDTLRRELWLPSSLPAPRRRRLQARPRALADHGALELGKGAEHLRQHAPGRAGGVDRLRDWTWTPALENSL